MLYQLAQIVLFSNRQYLAVFRGVPSLVLKSVFLQVTEQLGDVLYTTLLPNTLLPNTLLPRGEETNKFTELDWRIDVVLSNSNLAKVLQPEVC